MQNSLLPINSSNIHSSIHFSVLYISPFLIKICKISDIFVFHCFYIRKMQQYILPFSQSNPILYIHSFLFSFQKRSVTTIDIELKDRNHFKEFFHAIFNKLEDLMFTVFQKTPERLIPSFLMKWMDNYTKRRLHELEQAVIRQRWRKVQLEKAAQEIHSKNQDTKKAPSDD